MTLALIALAITLRAERPPVVPGTCIMRDDDAADAWLAKVRAARKSAKLIGPDYTVFCDAAGVPD